MPDVAGSVVTTFNLLALISRSAVDDDVGGSGGIFQLFLCHGRINGLLDHIITSTS